MSLLILPDDLEYHLTLNHPSLYLNARIGKNDFMGWVHDHETGLPRAVNQTEMLDYMYGGEYEERLENSGYDYSQEYQIMKNLPDNAEIYIDI